MNIDLNREDMISLVKGTSPNYSVMDDPLIKANGRYLGGFHDKWIWELHDGLTSFDLFSMYNVCKNSWKDGK